MTKDLIKNNVIAPMATAIWLIDNTSLSFKQIGDFCDFTEAEVKLIADGIIGNGVFAVDPTKNGNLTAEEIYKREQDGGALKSSFESLKGFEINIQKKKKYIPMLQRRSRPEAILWLVGYCPELSDSQIIKLVRTTKTMVQAIRNKTYNEYNDLVAKDPVVLGFCSQKNLDKECLIAREKASGNTKSDKKETKTKKAVRKINVNKVKIKKPVEEKKDVKKKEVKTTKEKTAKKDSKKVEKVAKKEISKTKSTKTSSKKSK